MRSAGLRRGAAAWGRAGEQTPGAVQERSAGLGRGASWGRAGMQREAAYGLRMGPCRGAARGRAGAQQRGDAHGHSSVRPHRGAAWDRAGAPQRGAV